MPHDALRDSVQECIRGQVQANGMESFWFMLKRLRFCDLIAPNGLPSGVQGP